MKPKRETQEQFFLSDAISGCCVHLFIGRRRRRTINRLIKSSQQEQVNANTFSSYCCHVYKVLLLHAAVSLSSPQQQLSVPQSRQPSSQLVLLLLVAGALSTQRSGSSRQLLQLVHHLQAALFCYLVDQIVHLLLRCG